MNFDIIRVKIQELSVEIKKARLPFCSILIDYLLEVLEMEIQDKELKCPTK